MKKIALLLVFFAFVSNGALAEEGTKNSTVIKKTVEVTSCSGEERDPLVEGNAYYDLGIKMIIKTAYTSTCLDSNGKKRFELIRFIYVDRTAFGQMTEKLAVLYFNSAEKYVFQKVFNKSRELMASAWSASSECPVLMNIVRTKLEHGENNYDLTFTTKCNVLD